MTDAEPRVVGRPRRVHHFLSSAKGSVIPLQFNGQRDGRAVKRWADDHQGRPAVEAVVLLT